MDNQFANATVATVVLTAKFTIPVAVTNVTIMEHAMIKVSVFVILAFLVLFVKSKTSAVIRRLV